MFTLNKTARSDIPLKFISTLSHKILYNEGITIRGKLMHDAKRLNISLKPKGYRDRSALDLDIDVLNKKVNLQTMVKNQFKVNKFDEDSKKTFLVDFKRKMPKSYVEAGEFFTVQIVYFFEEFYVSINERQFFSYPYKDEDGLHLSMVEIRGDVEQIVQFDVRSCFPEAIPATQYYSDRNSFSVEYPHLLYPGMLIAMNAIATGPKNGAFVIYFPSSFRLRTLLHFRVDFGTRSITRKAMDANMEYGEEEYDGPFNLELNKEFRIVFAFTSTHFLFAINGKKIPKFKYVFQPAEGKVFNAGMFNSLMGFKVYTKNNLKFTTTAIFNEYIGTACEGYELMSHPIHRFIV